MKYKDRFEAKDSFLHAWHFAIPEESMFADRVLLRLWLVVIVTGLCMTELAFFVSEHSLSGLVPVYFLIYYTVAPELQRNEWALTWRWAISIEYRATGYFPGLDVKRQEEIWDKAKSSYFGITESYHDVSVGCVK